VSARPDGFEVTFFRPPEDPAAAADPARYRLRRYRHVFRGAYHSPPTDEDALHVRSVELQPDGRAARLVVREPLLADRIYEVRTTIDGADPAVAHYTMNKVPGSGPAR
jgi:hypothetical protein